jgi:hypothetical protein
MLSALCPMLCNSDFPPGRRPLCPLRLPARRASLQLGEAGGRIFSRGIVLPYRTTTGPASEFIFTPALPPNFNNQANHQTNLALDLTTGSIDRVERSIQIEKTERSDTTNLHSSIFNLQFRLVRYIRSANSPLPRPCLRPRRPHQHFFR